MSKTGLDPSEFPDTLEPWESEMIVLFTSVGNMFGFRKSVGSIYGYMFCQDVPLHLEGIMTRLGMSKGTVSQGLNFLKKSGAVKLAFVPGDRREHFVPEIGLKRLVSGFLRDQVYPHMESGEDRLENLETIVKDAGERTPEVIHERIKRLRSWHKQAKMLLPFVQKFIDVGNK